MAATPEQTRGVAVARLPARDREGTYRAVVATTVDMDAIGEYLSNLRDEIDGMVQAGMAYREALVIRLRERADILMCLVDQVEAAQLPAVATIGWKLAAEYDRERATRIESFTGGMGDPTIELGLPTPSKSLLITYSSSNGVTVRAWRSHAPTSLTCSN